MSRSDKTVAVIDLGSNSFHLIIARIDENRNIHVIDRVKERIRLAAGLDENNYLTPQVISRALLYFSQTRERLQDLADDCVRVIGTDTFRRAKNGQQFLQQAQKTLERKIEIISGIEEARLIYKGISHENPSLQKRLVIDIGGGSTELIIGRGPTPLDLASTHMGCVSWTAKFFPDGRLTKRSFQKAIEVAGQQIGPIVRRFRSSNWSVALGSSGTIKAIGNYMLRRGLSDGQIHQVGLETLKEELITQSKISKIDIPSISDTRKDVIAGGVSILSSLFTSLRIASVTPVKSALREGALTELIGRMFGEDIREQTVDAMVRRLQIDQLQAMRVNRTAVKFFMDVHETWQLSQIDLQMLSWSARLHEVGMSIAFGGYHKHGAYILQNADMQGFSRQEQAKLSLIIRAHRGKVRLPEYFSILPTATVEHFKLVILLRLATKLNRRRSPKPLPQMKLLANGNTITLQLPDKYLHTRSLTNADLQEEKEQLSMMGFQLYLLERN